MNSTLKKTQIAIIGQGYVGLPLAVEFGKFYPTVDAPTAEFVDQLYASIIVASTYKAPNIKVAEAAKVIENCQRDLNISLVNELALIFDRLNLDTTQVLEAAGTKFNFLPFKPGLVGGHCISVDPYYLTSKAEKFTNYRATDHDDNRGH